MAEWGFTRFNHEKHKKQMGVYDKVEHQARDCYECKSPLCVAGWAVLLADTSLNGWPVEDAARDVLFSTPCAQERNALAAEYIKQFGHRGNYLYIDYEKKLLDIVDLEKSRAKSQD